MKLGGEDMEVMYLNNKLTDYMRICGQIHFLNDQINKRCRGKLIGIFHLTQDYPTLNLTPTVFETPLLIK